jgi:type II secretion system (T2SS) protein E
VNVGTSRRRKLGELLVDDGFLSGETLERALSAQTRTGRDVRLGGILLGGGVVPERALLDTLGRLHRCPAVGWAELAGADRAAFQLLPAARAYRLGAFPFAVDKRTLRVAFVNPSDLEALDEVAAITECRIVPAVTSEVRLMQAHQKFYGRAIPPAFIKILERLDRPARSASGARVAAPAMAPPPPPALHAEPIVEESEEDAIPFLVDAGASAPAREIPISGGAAYDLLPDPFSDGYSLTDFVADALAFGAPAREIFEGGASEALLARIRGDHEPQALGAPLAPAEDLDDTRPSRGRRPKP